MKQMTMASAIGVAIALAANASAASTSYYVDASVSTAGNGKFSSPLQTIAQVNNLALQSGDAVYFKCGASWPAKSELPTTLRLKPGVKYDSYYSGLGFPMYGCASTTTASGARPILRGSIKLTGLSWSVYSGKIFKASITGLMGGFDNVNQLVDTTQTTGSKRLQRARYPNIGSGNYSSAPGSRYLHMGPNTPTANEGAGSYLMQLDTTPASSNASNAIPANTNLTGAQAYIRQWDWMLSRFNVIGQPSTDTITVALDDPNHQPNYAIQAAIESAGGGYWLENQLWMLDSAGEWYVQKSGTTSNPTYTLYVWRPDGTAPSSSTTYYATVNNYGITAGLNGNLADASKVANSFSLKNIDVQDTVLDGITILGDPKDLTKLTSFTIDNVRVSRAGRFGIVVRGAQGATPGGVNSIAIKNSQVQYSMATGIELGWSLEPSAPDGTGPAEGIDVLNNSLTDIGLDMFAYTAIRVGADSQVVGNTIINAVSRGIDAQGPRIKITNNIIQNSCARIDDCGAIYTNGRYVPSPYNLGLSISGNVVDTVGGPATADGRRAPNGYAIGIYLDDYAANVSVTNNAVTGTDLGIFLHGATDSVVTGNQVDMSRLAGLSLGPSAGVEAARNTVTGNSILVRTSQDAPAVQLQTDQSNVNALATFSGNVYASRTAEPFRIYATDSVTRGSYTRDLSFAQWQATGLDNTSASRIYLNLPGYTPVSGVNLVANEGFNTQTDDWLPYFSAADGQVLTYLSGSSECYANGSCLKITSTKPAPANGWNGLGLYSFKPLFTVTPGHIYMVTFDAKSTYSNDRAYLSLNRYGAQCASSDPNNCYLSKSRAPVTFTTTWKRYAVPLEAAQTQAFTDGRVDLYMLSNGSVYLDNVRVIDVTKSTNPETAPFYMATNKTKVAQTVSCGASVSANCSGYRDLLTTNAVSFPLSLTPWGHVAVYWSASNWQDADADGIPGNYDQCPNTPLGAGTNEKGCGIGQ
jgi:parallel beta-helix repeat protein